MLIRKQNPQRRGKVCEGFARTLLLLLLQLPLRCQNIHSRSKKKKWRKQTKNGKVQQSVVGAKTDICRARSCVCKRVR